MASDVSQNMPNADQAGEGGATLAAVIEAKTEPKGLTAHQPYQLSDAKWLVEEGKQCSFWIDVTISTANGLILIAKDLQSIDEPNLRWQLSAGSEEITRHATVDMDLTPPLTGAMVGTFRVVFFVLIRLPTPQAQTEMVQLFGTVGAAAIKHQMWWAVLFHPAYGQALVPISKCQKSAFKCTMPYDVDHASTSVALFKDITKGQNAGSLTACLADLKVRHRLLSFAELKDAVEAAGASSGEQVKGADSAASSAPAPPKGDVSSTAAVSNGAGASAPDTAMDAGGEGAPSAGGAKGSTAGEAGGAGGIDPGPHTGRGGARGGAATGGGASGGGADSNGGRSPSNEGRRRRGQNAAGSTAATGGNGRDLRPRHSFSSAPPESRSSMPSPTGGKRKLKSDKKSKRSRNAASKVPSEPAKRNDKGGKNAWTDYFSANFAAKKAHMIKGGLANPSNKEVQAELLLDYKRKKEEEKRRGNAAPAPAGAVGLMASTDISVSVASSMFGGGGGGAGGGGGVAGSEDAKDGEGRLARKANKALKRKLKEAEALVASLLSTGASAAQTDAQARAGAHSAQRADQVSATAGASTSALSPSPPDSVKKLKRSIAGLNRAADYQQDSAHMQRLGELEYELSERIRKKKKYGTWGGE